ncbi:MAG: hypothetical protein LBU87_02475 [Lactobacillales bacterium]|jgi:hypothetical protein|nr:hypothetical protein [Lactobacillales bacterium]
MNFKKALLGFAALSVLGICDAAYAQTGGEKSNEQIAKDLSNPVANIINVPLQLNWDYGGGPKDKGQHYYLQIQPVIPFALNADWNLISRSILYVENKHNLGYESKTGLGDIQQTLFFSPKEKFMGMLWGAGPVFLIPTATEKELGGEKWGAGPSGVLVKETEKWTLGLLASQTWSFAGEGSRDDISKLFLQPFFAYHFPKAVTATVTSEYTYDWHAHEGTIPLNFMVAKVEKIGKMPVNFSLGARYYVDKPSGGPDWGLRAMITLVFPHW